jgi:DNA-binding transcriptional LysR family regulator
MDFRNLQYFYETARLGNFSKAAENLAVTQPALSMGIQNLERELKCQLFKRGRRLEITVQGERLRLHCEKLFALLAEMREDIALVDKGIKGVVIAGVLESVLLHVFPRIIADFAAACPDIVLKFEKSETQQIEQKRLATIAAGQSLFLLGNWQIEAVKNHTDLLGRFPEMNILHPVNCVAMLRQLVVSGLGMAILPDYVLGPDLRVLEKYDQLTMPVYLIRQRKRLANPIVDKFVDFIITHFPSEGGS